MLHEYIDLMGSFNQWNVTSMRWWGTHFLFKKTDSNVITGVIARESPYYNQVELNSKERVIF